MNQTVRYVILFTAVSAFAWLSVGSSPSASEQRGRKLFDLHCALCHENPPAGLKKQPPKLEGMFKAKHLPSGAPPTDKQVRKTIIQGLRTMPAFDQRLSGQDINDLVAYLHTLN